MLILQWNLCGYRARYADLKKLITDTMPACICLQETMLGLTSPRPPAGYSLIKDSNPNSTPGHGLAALIDSRYPFNVINLNTDLQAIAFQIHIDRLITVCNLYASPTSRLEQQSVEELTSQLPEPYILLGDFNAKHEFWGEERSDARGRMIASWLTESEISLLNTGTCTHFHTQNNSTHAVDLTLCSPSLYPRLLWNTMDDLYGSDHFPILIDTTTGTPQRQSRYNISRADWKGFRECLYESENVEELAVQERYDKLVKHIIDSADKNIPKTNPHLKRPVPWWTAECSQLRSERKSALRRYQRSGLMVDRINYKRARAKAQFYMNKIKRESWQQYISKITVDTPISKVWRRIRKISRRYPASHPPCLRIGDTILSDPDEVCEALAEHYSRVSSTGSYTEEFNRRRVNMERDLNFDITLEEDYNAPIQMNEIMTALNSTKDAAPGEDLITYSMLKNLHETALTELHGIVDQVWKRGMYVEGWRKSVVLSFLKTGKDPTECTSYRPVSLTSTIGKLMEKIVNVRLMRTLCSKDFLNDHQFGYRKRRSTTDNLMMLQSDILHAFSRKEHLVAIFFDLEKAFDTTWRFGILKIIHQLNLKGPIAWFIRNFLSRRSFVTRIGTHVSRQRDLQQGVPQGSVLSCTLFLVAINEILSDLPTGVTGLLYVDDLVIYSSSRYLPAIERRLQRAINVIENWTATHGFKFSVNKTTMVHFNRKRGPQAEPCVTLYGNRINCRASAKYLGAVFDQRLRWTEHIKELKTRATRALDVLKCVSGSKWGGDRTSLLRLYRSLIRSKLDYGCFIYWTASETMLKSLDPVHNTAIRIATGAFRTSPAASLCADSGEPPLALRRKLLALQYYLRVKQDPGSPVYKKINSQTEDGNELGTFGGKLATLSGDYGLMNMAVLEVRHTTDPIWLLPTAACVDFDPPKKTEGNSLLLKQLYYHHIYEAHRNSNHMYTDGSKMGDNVGCAILYGDMVYSKKLPDCASIYSAELKAVLKAVKLAREDSEAASVVIFTDSLSVKNAITSRNAEHPLIAEIMHIMLEIRDAGRTIIICWVPAHVGVPQNERADEEAKAAAIEGTRAGSQRVHYRDHYYDIKRGIQSEWEHKWRNSTNNKLRAIKDSVQAWNSSQQKTRRHEVVLCRLRIGHTRLTHKWILDGGLQPDCPHCNVPLSVEHLFTSCNANANLRRRYFPWAQNMDSRSALRSILAEENGRCDVGRIIDFTTEIGIISEI